MQDFGVRGVFACMTQNDLDYYRANEQRQLRAYRNGHVTVSELQLSACLAAAAAYLLETADGDGRAGTLQPAAPTPQRSPRPAPTAVWHASPA